MVTMGATVMRRSLKISAASKALGSPFAPAAPWVTWKSGRAGAVFYQLVMRSEQVMAASGNDS